MRNNMLNNVLIKRSIFVVGILIGLIVLMMIVAIIISAGNKKDEGIKTSSNTTNEVNEVNNVTEVLSKQEVALYNSKMEVYIGNNKTGIDARGLIDAVMTSNSSNAGNSGKFVSIEYKNFAKDPTATVTTTTTTSEEKFSGKIGQPGYVSNIESYVTKQGEDMIKLKTAVNLEKNYNISAKYNSNDLISSVILEEIEEVQPENTNTIDNNTVNNTVENVVDNNTINNNTSINIIQTNTVQENTTPIDTMKQQEIDMYNSKFKSYMGTGKSGVDAKSLIDCVISSNAANTGTSGRFVAIAYSNFSKVATHTGTIGDPGYKENNAQYVTNQSKNMTTLKAAVQVTTYKYNVEVLCDTEGYVVQVKITETK